MRFLRIVLLIGLMVACAVLVFTANSRACTETAVKEIVVQSGQTLWGIAIGLRPDRDPRQTIDEIMAINKLTDAGVMSGQRLLVPVYD